MSQPPVAPKHPVVHREHGIERPDDYHWLKDKNSQQTLAYLRAERQYYDEQMAPLKGLVDELTQEMVSRVPLSETSARWREGAFEYFTRMREGREFSELVRVDGSGHESVVLDRNELLGNSTYVEIGVARGRRRS